ncbi:MAG: hypothetical protein GY851_16830, partial [bacterium]|nr:hypothetical protein [bacterium]
EEYARGLLNDVIALEELAELNNSGKDFWTTNARYRAGVGSAEIERTLSLTSQRLHITVPLLGGVLTRTISLSPGVERIDCTVRFEGVPIDGRTLGLVFEIWGQGRAPVFGERFGAVVGRTCLDPYNLQTAQGDNPSGTALQPALRWMAVAPGDHIEAGIDMHIPLLPCQIVHGPDPLYARFARDLQDTLVMRGIPATVSSDTPPKLDVIWTDSTQFGALDDELRYGASMRILIGMPDQNALCKSIVASLDETDRAELHKRLAESGAAYIYHDTGRETGRIPTLILAGNTPAAAEAVVAEAVESIRSGGVFRIRPQDNLGQRATSPPTTGFAVLTRGATVCNAGRNGVIFLGLAHGSQWTRATGGPPAPPGASALEVEYALYPFSGTWREAAVPRAGHAFNEAFVGVVTTPHPGPMPLSQSFVTPTYPDFIVTALKPTGYPLIDAMGDEDMPALGGVTVRGYDSYGTPARVSLRFGVPARGATRSNLLELNRMPLNTSGGAITAHVSPFGIETFTAVPNAVRQNADSPDLDALPDAPRPLFTRYWQNNEGAPPMGYRSLTLLLDGDLSKASSSIRVTLANNDTQDRAAGTVTLTGPQSWSIAPMQFDYALAPGERLERQVVVLSHGGPGEDGIVAQTRLGGRTYMDVLTQRVPAIGVTVERSGAEVVATVANKSSLPAAGWVDLIAPPIAWPNPSGGDPGVRPHRQTVAVAAYDEQRLVFRVPTDPAPPWLTLKLAANGEVQYMPVPTAAEAPAP